MGHFVNQDRERHGRGQVITQEDAPLQRCTVGRAEFGVRVGQLDVAAGQEGFEKSHVGTWVAGHLGEFWQRLAIGLAHILSRDSATRPRQRRRGRRARTLTWPEFEVPVATRRIAASVQKTLARSGRRKSPVNPAAFERSRWLADATRGILRDVVYLLNVLMDFRSMPHDRLPFPSVSGERSIQIP